MSDTLLLIGRHCFDLYLVPNMQTHVPIGWHDKAAFNESWLVNRDFIEMIINERIAERGGCLNRSYGAESHVYVLNGWRVGNIIRDHRDLMRKGNGDAEA